MTELSRLMRDYETVTNDVGGNVYTARSAPLTRARRNEWSSADLRQLRELAANGTPLAAIAAALRRTTSAIRNKAGMHGISLRLPR